LAVIVLGAAGFYWNQTRRQSRQADLSAAISDMGAYVGQSPSPASKSFATLQEKNDAIVKSLTHVIARHQGSMEGDIATYLLGTHSLDRGLLPEAEKHLKAVVEDGGIEYANLARLALADLYASQKKNAEAERLLRAMIEKPSVTVTKESATLALARVIMGSQPEEARKLLDPMRTGTGAASRQAVTLLGSLPQPPPAKK
jgi:predicted negative regulator of RcsB-dependent stress response